jgi:hypothetical protein
MPSVMTNDSIKATETGLTVNYYSGIKGTIEGKRNNG